MPPSIKRYNLRQIFHPHIPKLQAHQFEGDETIPLVDLRHKMPPVYDQGDLGSCSANVLCAIYACDNPSLLGSRLFIYYNERSLHGSVSDDSGACLSDGIQALHTSGLCPETMWPYVDDKAKYKEKPPSECYEAAKSNEATAYHQVELSEKAIKSCLASGYPIAMGITLYKAFESDAVAANGRVPMPQPGEEPEGGHAVCMVGYDDNQREFIMRNSWGESWGDKGYFYLPYEYILGSPAQPGRAAYPSYASGDLWVITSVSNAPVPDPPTPIHSTVKTAAATSPTLKISPATTSSAPPSVRGELTAIPPKEKQQVTSAVSAVDESREGSKQGGGFFSAFRCSGW